MGSLGGSGLAEHLFKEYLGGEGDVMLVAMVDGERAWERKVSSVVLGQCEHFRSSLQGGFAEGQSGEVVLDLSSMVVSVGADRAAAAKKIMDKMMEILFVGEIRSPAACVTWPCICGLWFLVDYLGVRDNLTIWDQLILPRDVDHYIKTALERGDAALMEASLEWLPMYLTGVKFHIGVGLLKFVEIRCLLAQLWRVDPQSQLFTHADVAKELLLQTITNRFRNASQASYKAFLDQVDSDLVGLSSRTKQDSSNVVAILDLLGIAGQHLNGVYGRSLSDASPAQRRQRLSAQSTQPPVASLSELQKRTNDLHQRALRALLHRSTPTTGGKRPADSEASSSQLKPRTAA